MASELAAILSACVAGGASVSFLWPFTTREGQAYFASLEDEFAKGGRLLLGAFTDGVLVGTVQVILAMPPNQPHRAELAKLLVRPEHRGRGVASALVAAAEEEARARGKTLLVLDTVRGDHAERLYRKLGYTAVGVIPNYALFPDGRPCDTVVFYKAL